MTSNTAQQKSQLKQLITKGKEQGFLTYAEVNDHLPADITDPDQIEDIIGMINDMGIPVHEVAPETDELLLNDNANSTDEDAAEEAAAALASVESEPGRTTDPVRMYMREMGTVELLTREGEIVIAKRIEEGIREVMHALAYWPGCIDAVLSEYRRVTENEEGRLSEVLSGFISDVDDIAAPTPIQDKKPEAASDSDDDDEDDDSDDDDEDEVSNEIDPELAKEQFGELESLYKKAEAAIAKHGRESKRAETALNKLADHFVTFKLVPRLFDMVESEIRDTLVAIRASERTIMNNCIR
ncbi:MAG: RNA polymerase sigma factor RpoD, partial [Fuerstiella sp.]|nr:RNA polymerase sigma factor RpoD [Fuerstiella sp.]